jgi:hypothetical protein
MTDKQKWGDLSTFKKIGVALSSAIQVVLLGAALWDIRRRSDDEIKGSKRMWTAIAFVNYVGPIAYFLLGRK